MNIFFDQHDDKQYFDITNLPYEMIMCILSDIQFFDVHLYNSKNESGAIMFIDSLMSAKKGISDLRYNTLDFIANEQIFHLNEILHAYQERKVLFRQQECQILKSMIERKIFWGLGGNMETVLWLMEKCGFEIVECGDQKQICIGDTIENMNLKICSRFF